MSADLYDEARRAIRAAYGLKALPRAAAPQVLGFALGTELAPSLLSAAPPGVGVVVAPSDAAAAGLSPGAGEIPVWVPKAARVELWPAAQTLRLEDAQAQWRKSRPFEIYVNKQEERYERFAEARQRERDAAAAGAEVNSRILDTSPGRESYEVPPLVLQGEGDQPVFLTLDALVNTNIFGDWIDRPYWTRVVLLAGLAQRPDLLATSWRPPGAAAPLQKLSEEQRTEQLNAALRRMVLLPPTTRWADRLSLAVVPAAAPPRDDLLGYVPAPVPARYERSIMVRVDEVDEEDPEESTAAVAEYTLDAFVLLHPEDPELIGLVRAQDPAVPLVRGGFSYYVTDRSKDEKDAVRLAPVHGDEQIPLRAYLPLRKPHLEVAVDSLAELTQRLWLSPHQRGQLRRLFPGGQLMLEGVLYERCSNATTCRPAVPAGEAFAEELRARARRRPPAEILQEAEERMLAEAARHQLSTDQVRRYFRRTRDRWLRAIVAALPPPVPSAAVVDESPRERAFREAYEAGLAEELRRHPDEYGYGPQHIPQVARKMTRELRAGTSGALGDGARRAARALGIAPTKQAIIAWLNGGEDAAAAPGRVGT